jgi:hypothetical protein
MTSLLAFTPAARTAVVRAGLAAASTGRDVLGPEFLLLALADGEPLAGRPGGLGVSAAAVRAQIGLTGGSRAADSDLLAALGIDAAEVRRRAAQATGIRPDDPRLWTLRRSRLRPLRVTLRGPATTAVLDEGGRKVIEVATWTCRKAERGLAEREDLLWGLLADFASPAVQILLRLGTEIGVLWADLQRWNAGPA